ncbi:MAG: GAF domain-containing protein [Candidatus Lernaella stagnicola]|nr:GAF domain-containing protein [Candidatus Lernaella stagnicola]
MEQDKTTIALLTNDEILRQRFSRALNDFAWCEGVDGALLLVIDGIDEILFKTFYDTPPVIVLSATDDFQAARAWFRAGAADVLPRTSSPEDLATSIRAVLKQSRASRHSEVLAGDLFYLRDLSEAASEGAELTFIFDRIVDVVSESLGVDLVSLMLLEEDEEHERQVLTIKAARGLEDSVRRDTKVAVGEAISGKVIASGQPLLITDVETAGLGVAANRPRYANKSLLSVPIKARNQTIGVLNVNNKTNGTGFDQSDLALLTTLCNQAGLAIDNASLFEQLLRHADELAGLNEQLKRISQAKSELIVNLSHELKTPLTAIQGYVDLLRCGMIDPGKVSAVLEKVHERGRHLSRLAERLVSYFALDSGLAKFYKRPFKFDVFAWKCIDEIRGRAKVKQVTMEIDAPSMRHAVVGDEQHYRELLLALLDNAVKFNHKGGKVRLYGKLVGDGRPTHLEVFVADSGPGISEHLREFIFEDFCQTDDIMTTKPDGLGLGLAIAKAVTKGHDCDLHLQETGPDGTTFSFTIDMHYDMEEITN